MIPARVALLTNTISVHTVQVVTELFTKVRELRVFVSSPSGAELRRIRDKGFDVKVQKSFSVPGRWVHPIGFTARMKIVLPFDTGRQLRKYNPDVVISTECGLRSLQGAAYCHRQPRRPLILWVNQSEHTEAGRGRLRLLTRKWLLNRAALVLVNGQSGERYVERLGCDPAKVTKVHSYTIDINKFKCDRARSPHSQVRRLLYVGQLIERKGILPFVEYLGLFCVKNPEVRVELTIAGAGPLEKRLRAQKLGGQGTIRVLGPIPYGELPVIYANADIFVFPTLADEWGAVVNEAMSSGLPILGSVYSQAVEELVKDGVNGWVFRPNHAGETMAKLSQALFTSTTQLEQMGAMAAERISVVTPDTAADQIVDLISKVLHPPTLDLRLA